MKHALVTGVSGGLGREIALALLNEGVKVTGLSRTFPENLPIEHYKADFLDSNQIEKVIDNFRNSLDLDLIIHCAGTMNKEELGEVSKKGIEDTFKVNVLSQIQLNDGLLDTIKRNKGDIVFIGSSHSFNPLGNNSVYGSSKFAIRGYVKSLQQELRETPTRVLGVYPGAIKTKLSNVEDQKNFMDAKDIAKIILSNLKLPKNTQISEIKIDRKNITL